MWQTCGSYLGCCFGLAWPMVCQACQCEEHTWVSKRPISNMKWCTCSLFMFKCRIDVYTYNKYIYTANYNVYIYYAFICTWSHGRYMLLAWIFWLTSIVFPWFETRPWNLACLQSDVVRLEFRSPVVSSPDIKFSYCWWTKYQTTTWDGAQTL